MRLILLIGVDNADFEKQLNTSTINLLPGVLYYER